MSMKATYKGEGVFEGVSLEFDVSNMKVLWKSIAFLSSLPRACKACGSTDIRAVHRTTKEGYEYFEIECNDCEAVAQLGQKQVDGSLFYRQYQDWQKRPSGGGDGQQGDSWESARPAKPQNRPAPSRPPAETVNIDDEFPSGEDLPF